MCAAHNSMRKLVVFFQRDIIAAERKSVHGVMKRKCKLWEEYGNQELLSQRKFSLNICKFGVTFPCYLSILCGGDFHCSDGYKTVRTCNAS